jgi:NTE family protein
LRPGEVRSPGDEAPAAVARANNLDQRTTAGSRSGMAPEPRAPSTPKVALVLAGGAARGAYEVGVIQHLVEEVAKDLGRNLPLPILCGTSVGAINACTMAAYADEPVRRSHLMVRYWTKLRIEDILLPGPSNLWGMLRLALGFGFRPSPAGAVPKGLFDAAGLSHVLSEAIPFPRIGENLAKGRLEAVSISTTQLSSGRTVVFYQRAPGEAPNWRTDPTIVARAVELRAEHALASAAIPLFFPPVRIEDDYYCDGGLRQNVPFSPARKLGANHLVIIDPSHLGRHAPPPAEALDPERPPPADLALFGKVLNAVFLDHLDHDLDRLVRINSILEAGTRIAGPDFVDRLNFELGHGPREGLRPLRTVLVRSSKNIGVLATDFAHASGFRLRLKGLVGRFLCRMAEANTETESDLLSYLLFDGNFARQLIELGRADARAKHEELCAFFAAAMSPDATEAA